MPSNPRTHAPHGVLLNNMLRCPTFLSMCEGILFLFWRVQVDVIKDPPEAYSNGKLSFDSTYFLPIFGHMCSPIYQDLIGRACPKEPHPMYIFSKTFVWETIHTTLKNVMWRRMLHVTCIKIKKCTRTHIFRDTSIFGVSG